MDAFILIKVFLLFLIIQIFTRISVRGMFKITNLQCTAFDKAPITIRECRLRAVARGISKMNLTVTLNEQMNSGDVVGRIMQKHNGYKPFLYNMTIDACAFFKKRNHPVANIVYNLFKDFSNLNHSCPYTGNLVLKNFHLKTEYLKNLPMPNGEYALFLTWYGNKIKCLDVKVYYVFNEEEETKYYKHQ